MVRLFSGLISVNAMIAPATVGGELFRTIPLGSAREGSEKRLAVSQETCHCATIHPGLDCPGRNAPDGVLREGIMR